MKTLHTISAVVLFSLSTISFSNELEASKKLNIEVIMIESPSCNGGDNGSALVQAKGGQAPYTFLWNTFPAQSSPKASDLKAGVYFVQVKDALDSIFFKSIKIEDPTKSLLYASATSELELTTSARGLNAPYSYELDGKQIESDLEISQLGNGIHELIITDVNSCQSKQFIQVIDDNEAPEIQESKRILSKNDRVVMVSKLNPTIITNDNNRFEDNMVIMSDY
ncbi:MAG: hypothetical protein BM555_02905 [Crocinitomix sp. MedPE-SWsnd]|jgi:SprB repeat|nr:MAG: hypothetical protein BM555_02905 [Crocinitomix sp. MedPE-SWsnd]